MLAAKGGSVVPSPRRFAPHGSRWFLQDDQHSNLALLALYDTREIAQVLDGCVPALHRQDDLLGLAALGAIVEIDASVDPAIRTALLLCGPGADKPQCPSLEVEWILGGKRL